MPKHALTDDHSRKEAENVTKKYRVKSLASLAALAIIIAGCSSNAEDAGNGTADNAGGSTSANQTGSEAGSCEEVELFGVQDLTGPSAESGKEAQAGSQMAVDEINANGGITVEDGKCYTFSLSEHDFANNKGEAVSLFRQAAADSKVVAQIGPTTSVGFVPVVPLASQLKLPVISDGSAAKISNWNKWAYRVNSVYEVSVPAALKAVHSEIDFKRLAIIFDQTNDGQVAATDSVEALAKEEGFEIVSKQSFDPNTQQSYTSEIGAIAAANPDIVCIMSTAGAGGQISLQLANQGVTAPQFMPDGGGLDPTWWDTSDGAVEGAYTSISLDLNNPTDTVQDFLTEYKKAYPDLSVAALPLYGYAAVHAVAEAIKTAGSADREKIADALASLDTTDALGTKINYQNPPSGDNLGATVIPIKITGKEKYEVLK